MDNSFVLFYVSLETSPSQFHFREIGHTQKSCLPMGNSQLSMREIASVTASNESMCPFRRYIGNKRRSFQSEGESFLGTSLFDSFWRFFLDFSS